MEGRGGKGKRGERVDISDRINRRRTREHTGTVCSSLCSVGMFTVNYMLYIHTCT